MTTSPEMREFNTLVQLFDAMTMFQYDRVEPGAIRAFLQAKFGASSSLACGFELTARAVGYFAEEPALHL